MASEHRASRPYSKLRKCQQAFQETVLRVGKEEVPPNGTLRLSTTDFMNQRFQIEFGEDDEAFITLISELKTAANTHEISTDDLEIVIIVSSSYWKVAEKLFSKGLDEFTASDNRTVTIAGRDERARSFNLFSKTLKIEVGCLLAKTIEKRPLRPFRKGTWLTKVHFSVNTGQDFDGFEPKPLDAPARSRLGIGEYEETQRFMHVEADPTDPVTTDDEFGLYVDELTLKALEESPRTSGTSLIQRILGMDMARAIIYRASQAIEEDEKSLGDIKNSVFDKVLDAFSQDDKGAVDEDLKEKLFAIVKADPEVFVARVEDTLDADFGRDIRDIASGEA
ncbi:MAG: hypothetical protein QF637_08925 [Acidimicrobiales bacterium]|jgi:hypothetical protein|nr:hypothetical protein [Acidimicrobiales bacterium]